MNKALRKLIAFSSAAAMLSNMPLMAAGAKFVTEQVGDKDFETLIQTGDRNIYIENGTADYLQSDQLVVIDSDGNKNVIDLQEGITGLYNYVSTSMTEYSFVCPTQADYTFDFFDPNFRVSTEKGSLIVRYGSGYAIMNDEGKIVSQTYDRIQRISDDYFEVAVLSFNSENGLSIGYGVINSQGNVIVYPDPDCNGVFLTSNGRNFLVSHIKGKDYFVDSLGRKISGEFDDISGVIKSGYSWIFSSDNQSTEPIMYDQYNFRRDVNLGKTFRLSSPIYIFTTGEEKQLGINVHVPSGEKFSRVDVDYPALFDENGEYVRTPTLLCLQIDEDGNEKKIGYSLIDGSQLETLSNIDEVFHAGELGVKNPDSPDIIEYQGRAMHGDRYKYYTKRRTYDTRSLYDKDKNLIATGTDISAVMGGIWVTSGDQTYLYDHELKLVDGYDKITHTGDILFASKGSGNVVYDEFLSVLGTNVPAEIRDSEVINTADTKVYLVKNEGETYVEYTVYDSSFNMKGEVRYDFNHEDIKPSNVNVYVTESYSDRSCIEIHAIENYEYSGGGFDTDYYTKRFWVNSDGDISESNGEERFTAFGDFFRYWDSDNNCWRITGAEDENTIFNSLPGNCTDISYFTKTDENGEVSRYYIIQTTDGFTIYDRDGRKIHSFDTKYRFVTTTGAFRGDLSNIIMNDTDPATGKNDITIYDAYNDTIKYEVRGSDEKAVNAVGDNIVLSKSADSDSLWTSSDSCTQRIVDTSGKEILSPMNGVSIELKDYFFEEPTGSAYNRVIVDADIVDADEKSLIGDHGDSFVLITSGVLMAEEDIVKEWDRGICVPLNDIDSGYCSKYGYNIAIKADEDCYIVSRDGKWGMCDAKGKVLHPLDFDMICEYRNGIARTIRYKESEMLVKRFRSSSDEPEDIAPVIAELGIIDKHGKEIVEPFYDYERLNALKNNSVTRDGDTFRVRRGDRNNVGMTNDREKRYDYFTLNGECINNDITKKYGYDYAEKCGDYYIVTKNGLKGIVTAKNAVVVPVEYAEILSLKVDSKNISSIQENLREELSTDKYTSPIRTFADGSMLVNVRTKDGRIRALKITDDGEEPEQGGLPENVGDLDGNGKVDSSDASDILGLYADISTGGGISSDKEPVADVNGDGKVNSSDATFVLGYYSYSSTGGKMPMKEYMEEKVYETE